ncbi:MAG: carboxy terminal-processing peptidase [gamma proteobacterium symbiont of Bathyaustriella thionipta]|nr:carboxy terminal-processing peptidase [gamma proteobacterium symbiont of Bathyaustriella thionipta]MCU7951164.1 carboxy terminal-processing peptidase [gamma proteobacterium symbiont of Bathyaustriella thionipta]MCU7951871.1 carboxy terminal-processing peptidase [gamma proteobacterium symbiont of Bathyaustriella thionipta]MCU7957674.1 carboxy terminal-processing peptidase [gamma proteobacterium symbiont of Bathyaustriella thionipta]MCU7968912.1 carboxy terminal-processing peptidase [gamma pro
MQLSKTLASIAISAVLLSVPFSTIAKVYNAEEYVHPVSPAKEHAKLSFVIAKQLQYQHYRQMVLDDNLSSKVFDAFLKSLDPNRTFFLAEDIKKFEKFRFLIDNNFRRGELENAFDAFNLYQKRHAERLAYTMNLLENDYSKLDFSIEEEIIIKRDELPWPANKEEQDKLTRQQLKNVIISFKLAGKDDKEIQELLIKRYKNQINRIKQTNNEDAFRIYINALAESYDPHTQYFSPRVSENFDIQMSLSLEGIGAMLQAEDGYTKVKRLVPAGPAEKAGQLKAGDRIVGVGQGVDGDIIDVIGWRLDDVVQLIRGKKGTTVRLELIPQKAKDEHKTKTIQIVRNTVKLEEQAAKKEIIEITENGQKKKIGVIDIPAFYIDFKAAQAGDPNYKSTTRDVKKLVSELKQENIDGLIIDLRNNGGGSLQEVNTLVGLFIESGPTVQVKAADGRIAQLNDESEEVNYQGPLAVLVNRLSASASEIFAGAIQDYNRGLIIGNQTFGKGTVQALQQLEQGQIKLTHAKFYRVSGDSTQNLGVIPDLIFPALYDKDDIGESSLPEALPWDQVKNVEHTNFPTVSSIFPALKSKHEKRVVSDPDFQYIQETVARIDKKKDQKTLSLNFKTRQKEYKESRQEQLEIENKRRIAKGDKPFKNIKELDDEDDILGLNDEHEDKEEDKDKKDSDSYTLLLESAHILVDYIQLQPANLVHK